MFNSRILPLHLGALAVATVLLTSCGGSGGGDTATLSLGITDGPVDEALAVVVQFDGVEMQPESGDRVTFDFTTPMSIDLLDLQGDMSEMLLMNETVPAGEYSWIRLMVTAEEDGIFDSYLEDFDFNQFELVIPSGAQTGLQLNTGFTLAVGSVSDFTIDFDLRKSVTNPGGGDTYTLRPSLRLIDNLTVGTVSGNVSAELITASCAAPDDDNGSVYLYTGEVLAATDISGAETDPLTTALIDEDGNYEIGFVAAGTYSIVYTCESALDDPEVEDTLVFTDLATLEVLADTETVVDFDI